MVRHLKLVLADDHVLMLDGLTAVLRQAGHRVVAAVSDRAALDAAVRTHQPDICVVDSGLDDEQGIEAMSAVVSGSVSTRFVVLTADPRPDTLHRALDGGAAGYMHKTRGVGVLLDVLRRVSIGEIVVEGSFKRPVGPSAAQVTQVRRLAAYLTPREKQCLVLLTTGLDTTAMASDLGVSENTVRTHVRGVLSKLGVHSRLEAAALATDHQLSRRVPSPLGPYG